MTLYKWSALIDQQCQTGEMQIPDDQMVDNDTLRLFITAQLTTLFNDPESIFSLEYWPASQPKPIKEAVPVWCYPFHLWYCISGI